MAAFGYNASDEELAQLEQLRQEILQDVDNVELWEKVVQKAESLEGGLTRNSNPASLTAMRDVYDQFLAKFPLFFGYWRKYAEMEFNIAGTEAAEYIYERGIASISNSVDLWVAYCSFRAETNHEPKIVRELFERAANCVGYDFMAHPFWDKYLEYEERFEASSDRIFAILARIVDIPLYHFGRYHERFRLIAQSQPLTAAVTPELLAQLQAEVVAANGPNTDIESQLRARVDAHHLQNYQKIQTETAERWNFEQLIKRPYFHVTELDDEQMENWRKYLDFEEGKGDYQRIVFLYERCLTTAAYYDEFWLRYARWMSAQSDKSEDVRNIYLRACIYAPIAKPTVRVQWALLEEMSGRAEVAMAIYAAILDTVPGNVDIINAWANCVRRTNGLDAAKATYHAQLASAGVNHQTKAVLLTELARLVWNSHKAGAAEEARQLYRNNQKTYQDSAFFWASFLDFEISQPTEAERHHARVKGVLEDIRHKSKLPAAVIKELAHTYMTYLLAQGTKDVAKEYLALDKEINGPDSVSNVQSKSGVDVVMTQ